MALVKGGVGREIEFGGRSIGCGYDGAVVHGRKGFEAVAIGSVVGVVECGALGVRAVQADDAAFLLDACSLGCDRAIFVVGRMGELVEGVRRPRGKGERVRVRGRRKHSLVESVRREAVGDYLSVEGVDVLLFSEGCRVHANAAREFLRMLVVVSLEREELGDDLLHAPLEALAC